MKKALCILCIFAIIFVSLPAMPAFTEAVNVVVLADEGWGSATYDSATTVLTNVSEGYSFKLTKNDSNSTATLLPNGAQTVKKIVIPSAVIYNSKTYKITLIKEYILGNPSALVEEVIVSEGITALGTTSGSGNAQTFRNAIGLKNISLPSTLTFLSGNCFMGCTNLLSIDIPAGVTALPTQAFSACKALTTVTFNDNNITTLGNNCFSDCISLAQINNFPSSVTSIGTSAFAKTAITEFVVPAGVTEIKDSTFSTAQKLKSVVFKGNIQTLGANVFQYSYINTITFEGLTAPTSLGSFGRYDGTGIRVYYPADSTGYDAAAFRAFFTKTTFTQIGMYSTVFINISPGRSESELNATWSCDIDLTGAVLQIAPKTEGQTFPTEGVQSFTATQADTGAEYLFNKATATGLLPNTEYVYRVGNGDTWSPAYKYKTGEISSFDFIHASDSHIGVSLTSDIAAWKDTLAKAKNTYPNARLLLASGDSTDKGANSQFNGFFESDVLRSLPIASLGGSNHDDSQSFKNHFNLPNLSTQYGISDSGSDYYFTYGDALFMVLNTNNHSTDTHKSFMREVVEANPNYKWKFVMLHHSIYSAGTHSTSPYVVEFRNKLAPEFTALGVDAAFMGHDHGYVRTYIMNGTTPQPTQTVDEEGRIVNASGVQYITANSSTGNKFYDLVDPVQPWAQVRSQLYKPSFSGVSIRGNTMTITTYRTDTMEVIDKVAICKEDSKTLAEAEVILSADETELSSGGSILLSLNAKQGSGIDLGDATVTYDATENESLAIDMDGRITLKNIPNKETTLRVWARAVVGQNTFVSNAVTVRVKAPDFSISEVSFVGKKGMDEFSILADAKTLPDIDTLIVNSQAVKNNATDMEPAIIIGLYDSKNKLVASEIRKLNTQEAPMEIGALYPVSLRITIPEGYDAKDLYAEVFFWSDMRNPCPLRKKASLCAQ